MTDTRIIENAIEEVEAKTLRVTEQFLEIHQVVYENNKPKIARVGREKEDGTRLSIFQFKTRNVI